MAAGRPLRPNSDSNNHTMLGDGFSQSVPHLDSRNRAETKTTISKSKYQRPKHDRIHCKQCDDHPDGFRGEHELRRHQNRKHNSSTEVFTCVISPSSQNGSENISLAGEVEGVSSAEGITTNAGEMGSKGDVRGGQPTGQPGVGSHALQDYQMQLMLLDQQNKKRLYMARQEQDSMTLSGREGAPPEGNGSKIEPFQQGTSPKISVPKSTHASKVSPPVNCSDEPENLLWGKSNPPLGAEFTARNLSSMPSIATGRTASYELYGTGDRTHLEYSSDLSAERPTPSTLGWSFESSPLQMYYRFLPFKDKAPYFELVKGHPVTPATPARVYLDSPAILIKNQYPCQYPHSACSERAPFKRPGALHRHYQNVHGSPEVRETYFCDYPHCTRHEQPFTRKDHFRTHLRDYHKEDLGCARGERSMGRKEWRDVQKNWVAERYTSTKWWRCSKCLRRVQIATDGYTCKECKFDYDHERVERIKARRKEKEPSKDFQIEGYGVNYSFCGVCNGNGLIWDEGESRVCECDISSGYELNGTDTEMTE